ncbi:homocysteine S-methyltransferase [Rothia aerolata]|uniref:S-methylmethionine:homocysteine methyltransferase n=1 Tax=Rothia aerolata TaxID=1812262 RepID=A0A917MVP2_9MICC|nr:homocysteine S-methyltransferase [Rothia aerolata]GGH66994.1 homocysteine S-methyltransferase [Rothia aerolata]
MVQSLSGLLEAVEHPIIDGAMATELEKLGVDTAQELWSAAALLNQPEAIAAVHRSYFEAGAHVATTNTYQANIAAFEARGLTAAQSADLIKRAVHIAVEVRNNFAASVQDGAPRLVAGSVGPYGAYLADGSEYTGAYRLTDAEFRDFHRQRLALMLEAGADFLALETMPSGPEVLALLGLLADEFPESEAWLSLSLEDSEHLRDGTSLVALADAINASQQVKAVGLNCTALENVAPALAVLGGLVDKPLLVYPNSGEIYHADTKTWSAAPQSQSFGALVPDWIEKGAVLVGGCCRTTPADISEIASAVADG